ncbi:hypothetical protein AZG88_02710 [Rhodococcus sp. LB1]|nr:hypothetical protein AZG88_02710 [Rhodococcus sp. LB1]
MAPAIGTSGVRSLCLFTHTVPRRDSMSYRGGRVNVGRPDRGDQTEDAVVRAVHDIVDVGEGHHRYKGSELFLDH